MIFRKKIFQCVTAPIPLFQAPQKIGLLKNQTVVDTENLKEKFMFPLSVFLTWEKTKKMPIAAVGSTKLQGSVFVFLNQIAVKLGR